MKSTLAALAILVASATTGMARPDDRGWDGAGWYISGGASAAAILFNGPHDQQLACMEIYDRLYSPIGTCRYLETKPGDSLPALARQ